MKKSNIISSYIVYDKLYINNNRCNAYEVLKNFIIAIFFEKNGDELSILDIKNMLNEYYGFEVPIAVIEKVVINMNTQSDIKSVCGGNKYKLNKANKEKYAIEHIFAESNNEVNKILEEIRRFVQNSNKNLILSDEEICKHLCNALLIDESERLEFDEKDNLILKYIISCEKNDKKIQVLEQLKEGYIVYLGVCNDIRFEKTINENIVIYLDQEIIFYLMDLDNDISKESVLDLLKYIKTIDAKNRIKLRYFKSTKKEIDSYFDKACSIKEKNQMLDPTKIAMSKILKQCKDKHDINLYRADLFTTLKNKYQILEDEPKDYYDKKYEKYNLERLQLSIDNIPQDEIMSAMQYISNINKLRQGENNKDFFNTKAFFITNTINYLKVSQHFAKEDNIKINFAYSLNGMINRIWFLSSKKYNLQMPTNFKVYNYVKNVMQKLIGDGISKEYDKNMKEWLKGELDEEKVVYRIKVLSDEQEKLYNKNTDPKEWEQINTSIIATKALSLEKSIKVKANKDEEIERLKKEVEILKNEKNEFEQNRLTNKIKRNFQKFISFFINLIPFIIVMIIVFFVLFCVNKFLLIWGITKLNEYYDLVSKVIIILGVLIKIIFSFFPNNKIVKKIKGFVKLKFNE